MRFYRFYGYIYGEKVAGIVKANNKQEAKQFLKHTYCDYDSWEDKTLEQVIFNDDNICEVYYGC